MMLFGGIVPSIKEEYIWGVVFLLGIGLGIAYVAPRICGRPYLLGSSLVLIPAALIGLVAQQSGGEPFYSASSVGVEGSQLTRDHDDDDYNFDDDYSYYYESDDDYYYENEPMLPWEGIGGGQAIRSSGVVAMFFGLFYLLITYLLDRKRLVGASTPFLVVGVIVSVWGIFATSISTSDGIATGGLLSIVVGLTVSGIAMQRSGRASTWTGALAISFGAIAIIGQLIQLDGDRSQSIVMFVVAATFAAMAAIPRFVRKQIERMDEDQANRVE
jgi:hypothetical protein